MVWMLKSPFFWFWTIYLVFFTWQLIQANPHIHFVKEGMVYDSFSDALWWSAGVTYIILYFTGLAAWKLAEWSVRRAERKRRRKEEWGF